MKASLRLPLADAGRLSICKKMRPNLRHIRTYQGHRGPVYSLQPSGEAGKFLSCSSDGFIAEWDMHSGEGETLVQYPGAIFSFRVFPEHHLLAAGTQSGLLCFADLRTRKVLHAWEAHAGGLFDLALLPDGTLAASGADGSISIWDMQELRMIRRVQLATTSIRTLAMLPNQHVAAGSSDGQIRILDSDLRIVDAWQAHRLSVFRLLWSEESQRLWSVGRDAQMNGWELGGSRDATETVPAHMYAINDLVHGPQPGTLLTASMDKTIKIWSERPLSLLRVADRPRQGVHAFGVNRLLLHGNRLLSCSDDKTIMEWEWVSEEE